MSERKYYPSIRTALIVVVGVMIPVFNCTLTDNPLNGGVAYYEDYSIDDTPRLPGTEEYSSLPENPFFVVEDKPVSTFSVDVDVASYANCRRFVKNGQLPPTDAVRIEEMINYFDYDYPQPVDRAIGMSVAITQCPWNKKHLVARIGLKAGDVQKKTVAPSHLTFLIDVSGSMSDQNKLPLLKEAFKLLVEQLGTDDRVAIVVYASSTRCILQPTSGVEKERIIGAIDELYAGGSTAGAAGIQLAYQIAEKQFSGEANNRVVLATDGDFNVGVSSDEELVKLIEEKRDGGIYLTVLGFGMGNYKDAKMEGLADHGNGNYAYIDNWSEARKVFVHDLTGMFTVVAKDVKVQVDFNAAMVNSYRLLGYENRALTTDDFTDDKKDAGEMGAGQTVTACYELIPVQTRETGEKVENVNSLVGETTYLGLNVRYTDPDDGSIITGSTEVGAECVVDIMDPDLQFTLAVTEYGLLLKNSEYRAQASCEQILSLAAESVEQSSGSDFEYRAEFIELVHLVAEMRE